MRVFLASVISVLAITAVFGVLSCQQCVRLSVRHAKAIQTQEPAPKPIVLNTAETAKPRPVYHDEFDGQDARMTRATPSPDRFHGDDYEPPLHLP